MPWLNSKYEIVLPLSYVAMSLTTVTGSSLSVCMAEGSALVTRISIMASIGGSLEREKRTMLVGLFGTGSNKECENESFPRRGYLRLGVRLQSLNKIADWIVDHVEIALVSDIQCCWTCAFLEEWASVFHELIEVEVNADGALE